MAKIQHIHTKDLDLDRVQHAIAKSVEPFLTDELVLKKFYPILPLPSSSLAWQLFGIQQPGQPTQIVICVPNSVGVFEWIVLGQSS